MNFLWYENGMSKISSQQLSYELIETSTVNCMVKLNLKYGKLNVIK